MRYMCIVAYDGANYVGFQSQINGIAIQDVIEAKLEMIFSDKIKIVMSSRTDSGVHALGQVFHFDSPKTIDTYKLKGSLNSLLPKDIYIKEVKIVSEDFHSRFSTKKKEYRYVINLGERDVFLNKRVYDCFYKLDLDLFKKTAALFIGRHDFTSFNTSTFEEAQDQTRVIEDIKIISKDDLLIVEIVGEGFLRHMVRMLVGTMIDVARGQKSLRDVEKMLAEPSKDYHVYNVSPYGLYLVKIYY